MNQSIHGVDRAAGHPNHTTVGLVLMLAGFLPVMLVVTLSAAVPAMLAHFRGMDHATTLVPLLLTAPGLLVALLSPIAGFVVERVGRRRPLIIASFTYAVLGMIPLVATSFPAIFATRLALGACEAFIIIATNVLLIDYFDLAGRRFWLTVQTIVSPVLAAAVATLAGVATTRMWNGAFLCYALALPVAVAITLVCHDRPVIRADTPEAGGSGVRFPRRRFTLMVGTATFSSIMFYVFIVQGGLAFAEVGMNSAAALGGYIGITTLSLPVGALFFNLFSRRLRPEMLMALCLSVMALGMAVVGLASGPEQVLIGGFIQQMSAGMSIGSLVLWASIELPAQYRGRGLGVFNGCAFAGQFLSPLAVGGVRSFTTEILPAFLLLGGICLLGAIILALLARCIAVAPEAPPLTTAG